jgi:hypothetical protein
MYEREDRGSFLAYFHLVPSTLFYEELALYTAKTELFHSRKTSIDTRLVVAEGDKIAVIF